MVDPNTMSRRERQIMDIIFAGGEATVRQIQELLDDPPKVMAVRRMLLIFAYLIASMSCASETKSRSMTGSSGAVGEYTAKAGTVLTPFFFISSATLGSKCV